jgi:hypothetical protein
MGSFKQACPSCEASVPIKDEGLIGKKIDCPKCKFRFVVQAPKEELAAAGKSTKPSSKGGSDTKGSKNLRSEDDGDETPKTAKKKKESGGNPTLVIGGAIGGLAVVLLIVAFMFMGGSDDASNAGNQPRPNAAPSGELKALEPDGPAAKPVLTTENSKPATDVTGLILDDAASVLAMEVPKLLETPIGVVLFDGTPSGLASEKFFETRMGFPLREVTKWVVAAGEPSKDGMSNSWVMNILQTKNASIVLDRLRPALGLNLTAPTRIKSYDYYPVTNPELLRTLEESIRNEAMALVKQIPGVPTQLPTPKPTQWNVHVYDDHTVVLADTEGMKRFLEADRKPRQQTQMMTLDAPPSSTPSAASQSEVAPANPMGSPSGSPSGPPPIGGPGMIPPGASPGTPGQPRVMYDTDPRYRTLNSSLRRLIQELDKDSKSVAIFVQQAKMAAVDRQAENPFSGVISWFDKDKKAEPKVEPKTPAPKAGSTNSIVVGLALLECDSRKLAANAAVMLDQEGDVKKLEESLQKLPLLDLAAAGMSEYLGIEVAYRRATGVNGQNSEYPGGSPGAASPGYPGGSGYPARPGAPGMISEGGGVNKSDILGKESPRITLQRRPPPMLIGPNGQPVTTPPPVTPMNPMGSPGENPGLAPTTTNPGSFISMSRTDNVLNFTVELLWDQQIYFSKIIQPMRSAVATRRGRATLLGGRNSWFQLATAGKNLGATPIYPRGASNWSPDASRFGKNYPAEERLSWMVDLLPGLGYDAIYRRFDLKKSWTVEENLQLGETWIPEFLNPSLPQRSWQANLPSQRTRTLGATHFVGLSGIGLESGTYADTPANAKKLGLFGYDRQTATKDVTDGLSNTIFMIQVAPDFPRPWVRGGGATVQGVPEKNPLQPFVTLLPGGKKGTYAIMADGSVRFVSQETDPETFKALVTYKGGEKVSDLDKNAPKVNEADLKGPAAATAGLQK